MAPRGRLRKVVSPSGERSSSTFTKSYEKQSAQDIEIEERLAACGRSESEHIIYVGNLVERTMQGEFGSVLRALTAGRISIELQANRDGKLSSDRILGRCEMADNLWHDLEQFIHDKDMAMKPVLQPIPVQTGTATFPNPVQVEDQSFVYTP